LLLCSVMHILAFRFYQVPSYSIRDCLRVDTVAICRDRDRDFCFRIARKVRTEPADASIVTNDLLTVEFSSSNSQPIVRRFCTVEFSRSCHLPKRFFCQHAMSHESSLQDYQVSHRCCQVACSDCLIDVDVWRIPQDTTPVCVACGSMRSNPQSTVAICPLQSVLFK